MTLQELLDETQQLNLRDQLYLVTQLLEWIQQQVSPDEQAFASSSDNLERGSINCLIANPLPVCNFKSLSREEIYQTISHP